MRRTRIPSFSGSCRSARSAAAAGIRSGGSVVTEIAGHQALRLASIVDEATAIRLAGFQILDDWRRAMEASRDQLTSFTYTIYIHATPEQVWQGLTDPAYMRGYWRHQKAGEKTFRSDWKKGSTYDMKHDEVGLVVSDPEQVILDSDPYRRLAYTWHTITPEWAAAVGMDEDTADIWRAEPRSKVAFDIEDVGHGTVSLTVVHDGFEPGSHVLQGISEGWPAVLSSLKTLLETGSTLRTS
jgi:uncharacterized protein YndB with AHSA1/START domain